jgi:hypothetical protein
MSYIGSVPTTASFPFDQFSGTGSQTAFTLSQAPASTTSIVVAVSGVTQNPNTYSVSGTTLTFTGAPPSGTNNVGVLFLGLPSIVGVPNAATVGLTQLSATGTPSSTTFLRGDNTWNGVASLTTASGTAPSYSARAWVNFNGTGTVAIRASGNVSSITDGGVGVYTVNFTNAMPDVNYAVTGICHSPGATNGALQAPGGSAGNQLVGSVQVNAITGSMNATFDASYVFVVIHR